MLNKQKTIKLLNEKLSKIPEGHFVLMITHQVVISEITGNSPAKRRRCTV
jgi:hypothetical protein